MVREQLNLYYTPSCPILRDYMETRRSEWEEDKEFSSEKVRATDLEKYNNLITSVRCYTKDTTYAQVLAPFGVDHNIMDDSKKTSEKYNRDARKGETSYIRYLPPWILEHPKGGVGKKTNDGK